MPLSALYSTTTISLYFQHKKHGLVCANKVSSGPVEFSFMKSAGVIIITLKCSRNLR